MRTGESWRTLSRARRAVLRAVGSRSVPLRRLVGPAVLVSLLGLVLRLFYVADLAPDLYTTGQPGIRMAARYTEAATAILEGDGILYPRIWPDPSDTGLLSRPPGYPAFVALVHAVVGRTYLDVMLVQAFVASLVPPLLLLLTTRAVGRRAGLAAGVLAAVSPPLAYYPAVLTPDSLAAALSVAITTVLWCGRRRVAAAICAGALCGIATWLRPNFLLLPLLLLVVVALALPGRRMRRRAILVVAAAWLIVAPITIRNFRLYHELVPVSSNFGIVLWEGIADLGGARFGARSADREVAREEAARWGMPSSATWWASPDGIRRDRDRVRRSLEVIRAHPLWFSAGCLRRAGDVLDVGAAAPLVSASVSRPPADSRAERTWLPEPAKLGWLRGGARSLQHLVSIAGASLRACGLVLLLVLCPRRTLLLLAVPLYVAAVQSPVHFEPRFALPLYAFSPLVEGVAWAVLLTMLLWASRGVRDRPRPSGFSVGRSGR